MTVRRNEVITIRESRENDTDALRHLFLSTRVSTFTWTDTSRFKLSDFEEETKGEFILVAFVDEIPVGFVSVWTADNFIHHLYVDNKFQHQSVGTQLLNAVLNKFDLPVRLKCEEDNTKAIRFYRKKGFVEKEKGQSAIGTYILFELNKKENKNSIQ